MIDAIRARSFGTLITATNNIVAISHCPFAVSGSADAPILLAHLARANPQLQDLASSTQAVASFLVDDAYISPGWYPSKAETGKVVPTWNYVAIEARGSVELVDSGSELLALVDILTSRHEADRREPWSTSDAPAEYTAALLRGIVGIRIRVADLTGAWKLDQKKRDADRAGAAAGLLNEPRGHGIGRLMSQ